MTTNTWLIKHGKGQYSTHCALGESFGFKEGCSKENTTGAASFNGKFHQLNPYIVPILIL